MDELLNMAPRRKQQDAPIDYPRAQQLLADVFKEAETDFLVV